MKKINLLKTFSTILSIVLGLAFISEAQAQLGVPETSVRETLDKTKLIESSISKVYRARVLLEDHKNWPESYELLRDVIKNDESLDPVIKDKLQEAAGQISRFLPGKWFRKVFNARHLVRPFLESSYLINEALMDWRVALNSSSDSEVPFVEALLKSYFFAGSEAQGEIEFPNPSTYSFDLFALTAENISKAKREKSTSSGASDEASLSSDNLSSLVTTPNSSLEGSGLTTQFNQANGFLDSVINSGINVTEVTDEVQKIIKRFNAKKRVNNRYLELSMLLQAVTDPGSALFDPQLQAFLSGVKLKLALGVTDKMNSADVDALREVLGRGAVVQGSDGTRILLSRLIEEQKNNPFQRTSMELQINQVDGTGRSVLYAISSVAGEDLMRLKTLHIAAVLARDFDKISAVAATPIVVKGVKLAHLSWQTLLKVLPKAAVYVSEYANTSAVGPMAKALKAAAGILKGAVWLQNLSIKAGELVGPKTVGLVSAIKNNKYVKNGTVAGVLTFVAAAVQLTIGVVEYRHADDEDVKKEIYVNTLSRTGATLSYALPVVGWGAAVLDLSHAFLGVPVETADLFKGVSVGTENVTYWFIGTNRTEVAYSELDSKLNLPRPVSYFKLRSFCENTVESCESALMALRDEMRDVAFSQMVLLYVAHRSFASDTNNRFGARIEDYIRGYQENRRAMRLHEQEIFTKLKTLSVQ